MDKGQDTIVKTDYSPLEQREAAYRLLARILPEHTESFEIDLLTAEDQYDAYEISSANGRIRIAGTTGVAIASGIHRYLRDYCNAHFSWTGDHLEIPDILPAVEQPVIASSPFNFRYYLNYCTFSYSAAWWDWERWEREIDLMALHGINLPLSIVGHEIVWANVFRSFGFDESEILLSFSGPAFRAWGFMENIESWGGPLPKSWINNQMTLQMKILERQRELGMKPVLQGFSGVVPERFKKYYPQLKLTQIPGWYGYRGMHMIDPSDPIFWEFGKRYMEEQKKIYGTNHFYSTDIYHEIDCADTDLSEVVRVSDNVMKNMLANDPQAVWVIQSWTLKEDSLDILPDENVMVLDLYCDTDPKWKKNSAFKGKPWIWCALQNFGGRTGMSGKIRLMADEIPRVLADDARGKLSGIGFAPEGIEGNPIFLSMLSELAWRKDPLNFSQWMKSFVRSRYGRELGAAEKAWDILLKTVYTGPEAYGPMESEICARPSLEIKSVSSNGKTELYYKPELLVEAWKLLLECGSALSNSPNFKYDLIDVSRQVLANYAKPLYKRIVEAYQSKNGKSMAKNCSEFLILMEDMDELLSTNKAFLLGRWLEDAKKMGQTTSEKYSLEWNARRQITLWSSPQIDEFHDYANKQWAGLIEGYYLSRWKKFFLELESSLAGNKEIDFEKFKRKVNLWAVKWSHMKNTYPSEAKGSEIELSNIMFEKYKKRLVLQYDLQ